MDQKTVKVSQEILDKIQKVDASIVYWSVHLGQAVMRQREIESQLGSLYMFKTSLLREDLKRQGIDVQDCDVEMNGDSIVVKRVKPKTDTGG